MLHPQTKSQGNFSNLNRSTYKFKQLEIFGWLGKWSEKADRQKQVPTLAHMTTQAQRKCLTRLSTTITVTLKLLGS